MLKGLRTDVRRLVRAIARLREQGHGWLPILFFRLPIATLHRAYRPLAVIVNRRLVSPVFNDRRFKAFETSLPDSGKKRFFVIVMPGVLHFLLPCLRQIPPSVDIVFIHNGSATDEQHVVEHRYPRQPQFRLTVIPGSSLSHGDVLTLLLEHSRGDFGIIDHDLYIFDQAVFDRLAFADGEILRGVFGGENAEAGLLFPHTFFLYLRVTLLRDLMRRHGVTARMYRRAPRRLRGRLAEIGLGAGRYLKGYVQFYDTLQLLVALAYSEGLCPGFIPLADARDAIHVGGTSAGTQGVNMEVGSFYIRARFLELACNAVLPGRYHNTLGRFRSSAEIRPLLPRTPETLRMLGVLDRLLERLEAADQRTTTAETERGMPATPKADQGLVEGSTAAAP